MNRRGGLQKDCRSPDPASGMDLDAAPVRTRRISFTTTGSMAPGTRLFAAMLVLAAAPAAAQDGCAPTAATGAADTLPDVLIRATATAREVRFATRPRTSVRALGCGQGVTVTERVNLPDPVEPGVTYRDVRVGVDIRADVRVTCLLPALAAHPALAGLCAPPPSHAPPAESARVPNPTGLPPAAPPRR